MSRYSPKVSHPQVMPSLERRPGDVLDSLHHLDQRLVPVRAHGSEPHSAVPHHRGGHAMPTGRGQVRVPGGLAVVVGVDVDEARGDHQAVGVDLAVDRPESPDRPR